MQKTLVPAFPEVLENCYAIVESGQKIDPNFLKLTNLIAANRRRSKSQIPTDNSQDILKALGIYEIMKPEK